MSATILIAESDLVQRHLLESLCNRFGYEAEVATSGAAALERLSFRPLAVDLLILDLALPDMDGMAVLSRLKEAGEKLPVIVTVSQTATHSALAAVQAGAQDFVVKPAGAERLSVAVKNALYAARLEAHAAFLGHASSGTLTLADLAARSADLARAVSLGERAAKSSLPVLLEGEPGTGREIFARAIHGQSTRRGRVFVALSCAGLPSERAAEVLFGEGSQNGPGKFAEAHGGTLFLGDIGKLPLGAQEKLMQVLTQRPAPSEGGRRPQKGDVRLISSAGPDLIELVKLGRFREDLFYRLNALPIFLPPLRSCSADIGALAERFCARFAATQGKRIRGICAEAQALLCAYDWPGNIRELENAIFRAVVLTQGDELTIAEFPQVAARVKGFSVRIPPAPVPLRQHKEPVHAELHDPHVIALLDACGHARTLDAIEAEAISFALKHYRGQMSAAARKLGIGRSTLYRKLKQHGLAQAGAELSHEMAAQAARA